MKVIQAHRDLTGQLAETFLLLLETEKELFEFRSKSWGLQMLGSDTRESDLEDVHQAIDRKMEEVERLRHALSNPAES